MMLADSLANSGNWLFRHRSNLPLLLFIPVIAELWTNPASALRALSPWWSAACLAVSTLGLVIRVVAVGHAPAGTSGRNTHGQVAEVLNTTGLYSVVRHPLYVGNTLMWIGPALLPRSWMVATLVLALIVLFYERIIAAEEAFLRMRFGAEFEQWAAVTPAVIPALSPRGRRWRGSALPFSWRTVARREYSGLFGMIASFSVLLLIAARVAYGRATLAPGWTLILVGGALVYVVLLTLKRRTRLLSVSGR